MQEFNIVEIILEKMDETSIKYDTYKKRSKYNE